jgi:hypothetical protein
VELGEIGGVHGYVALIDGDTEPAQEFLERGLEGAPTNAAALLEAEVNAHLARDGGQRVRARLREEAALARVDAELGLERHEHIHAATTTLSCRSLGERRDAGRGRGRQDTGRGVVRSGPHTGGGRVGVGTREREGDGRRRKPRGETRARRFDRFSFVSTGSGSELFFEPLSSHFF